MTKLLERAVSVARKLPPETQDDIARLQLIGEEPAATVALTAEERTAVAASKAAAERGEFATDDDVRAVWTKHG